MINAVRTWLMNKAPANRMPLGWFGEEFVDAAYVPVKDTSAVASIRGTLFGTNADILTQNYRLAQFMSLLHADPLTEFYVKQPDLRTTYRIGQDTTLMNAVFGSSVLSVAGGYDLILVNPYQGDDVAGINYRNLSIAYDHTGQTVTVSDIAGNKTRTDSAVLAVQGGMYQSPLLPLLDTNIQFALTRPSSPSVDGVLRTTLASRPSRDPSQLLASVDLLALQELWQPPLDSNLNAFQNLYHKYDSGVQRKLAAILLSLAYTTGGTSWQTP
jgi:hypothetical protein